jgi:molybdopterin/thiamine biosynthesis adenylyltransferase
MGIMKHASRYLRQELIVGKVGQQKISKAHVAIVGLGALGTVSAELLTRAGIGTLTIIDRDVVEESNLQRQTLYSEKDVGEPKAQAASKRLREINSSVIIDSITTDINHKNITKVLKNADIILDCTDNLYTRFLINDFSGKYGKPLVYAGCILEQGSVALLTYDTACFRCFTQESVGLGTCDTAGVLNTASAMTASLQVQLALQWIINGNKTGGKGKLFHLNLKTMQLSALHLRKNHSCEACKGNYGYLDGKREPKTLQYQCLDLYQFFMEGIDLKTIEKKAKKLGKIKKGKGFLMFGGISVFGNGRILVRAKSLEQAKSLFSRYIGN